MNAEKWLDQNTFYCPDLRARVSAAQCAANRAMPGWDETTNRAQRQKYGSNRRPDACGACTEFAARCAAIGRAEKEEEKIMTIARKGACRACGRADITLPAHGLCGRCYRKVRAGHCEKCCDPLKMEQGAWLRLGDQDPQWVCQDCAVELSAARAVERLLTAGADKITDAGEEFITGLAEGLLSGEHSGLHVDFTDYQRERDWLNETAANECRSESQQIVWLIRLAMQQEKRPNHFGRPLCWR